MDWLLSNGNLLLVHHRILRANEFLSVGVVIISSICLVKEDRELGTVVRDAVYSIIVWYTCAYKNKMLGQTLDRSKQKEHIYRNKSKMPITRTKPTAHGTKLFSLQRKWCTCRLLDGFEKWVLRYVMRSNSTRCDSSFRGSCDTRSISTVSPCTWR